MQKLVDRFETIFRYSSRPHELEAANEAKKIAIEFDKWQSKTTFLLGRAAGLQRNIDAWLNMSKEERFDKFIEEYYG